MVWNKGWIGHDFKDLALIFSMVKRQNISKSIKSGKMIIWMKTNLNFKTCWHFKFDHEIHKKKQKKKESYKL
jgi:hypothetical protein